jgi:hypothetical protein
MLVRGRPVALEYCPIERGSSVFNSELNSLYRIPCLKFQQLSSRYWTPS